MSEKEDYISKIKKGLIDDDSLIGQLFIALSTWWYSAEIPVVGVSRKTLSQIVHGEKLDELLKELKNRMEPLNVELIEYNFNQQRWYCLRSRIVAPSMLTEKEQSVLGVIIFQIYYPTLIERRRKEQSEVNWEQSLQNDVSDFNPEKFDLFDDDSGDNRAVSPKELKPEFFLRDKKSGKNAKTAPNVEIAVIRNKLLGKYFNSKNEIDRIIQKLSELGYIINEKKRIFFGPRTLFEFPIESLEEIAESVANLLK